MKKIILLGTIVLVCIILMSNSASAVEYRAVVENNTHKILSQETTILEKLTKLIPTLKIKLWHPLILLIISLTTFIPRLFVRVVCRILVLILTIIRFPVRLIKIVCSIFKLILKIVLFPSKLITKSATLLIILLKLVILSSYLHFRIYRPHNLWFIPSTVH